MFCPKCKSEYREGFEHCKDCDLALVDHLDDESGKEDKWDNDFYFSEIDEE